MKWVYHPPFIWPVWQVDTLRMVNIANNTVESQFRPYSILTNITMTKQATLKVSPPPRHMEEGTARTWLEGSLVR